jgi:hypothetical protein
MLHLRRPPSRVAAFFRIVFVSLSGEAVGCLLAMPMSAYRLRVLRRMSRTAFSAGSFWLIDFCLIFVPFGHYDEPRNPPL